MFFLDIHSSNAAVLDTRFLVFFFAVLLQLHSFYLVIECKRFNNKLTIGSHNKYHRNGPFHSFLLKFYGLWKFGLYIFRLAFDFSQRFVLRVGFTTGNFR